MLTDSRTITSLAALFVCGLAVTAAPGAEQQHRSAPASRSADQPLALRIIVMDPLALPLSCACIAGLGQRRYEQLGKHLESRLKMPVKITFAESLQNGLTRSGSEADVVIGKHSVVEFDAKSLKQRVRPIAYLTDSEGTTWLRGVLVVRRDHAAEKPADLGGRKIVLGPPEDEDCHRAAKIALSQAGLSEGTTVTAAHSLDEAAYAVIDGEADAAFLPEYMPTLLAGCGKIEPDELRVIHRAESVNFVTAFATETLPPAEAEIVRQALLEFKENQGLLAAMESRHGFVAKPRGRIEGWTDWRGPGRRGLCSSLPATLPQKPHRLWTAEVTGPALAGMAATEKYVVVPDKDAELNHDVFRCFDATTGKPIWNIRYEASRQLDYSNAPRACPVIDDGRVYLQGALGDLHCVELQSGRILWKKNILDDFNAELLTWGCSSPPLIVDDRLIVNPGSREASLAALDCRTGKVLWTTPGNAAAYSAFIVASVSGTQQIIGYDSAGLGGWDARTGKRLWTVVPRGGGDFNVGTPALIGDSLLVATENNATRLYGFDASGRARAEPLHVNEDLAPDTVTPVVISGRVFAAAYGELYCLDLKNGLKTLWSVEDDIFYEHSNLIAGNDRVLIWTTSGDLLLIRADSDGYEVVSRWRPFQGEHLESMSHPAIVGHRLYLRTKTELVCLSLTDQPEQEE